VIAAILSRDGKPVELRELEQLAARARLPCKGVPLLYLFEGAGLVCVPAREAPSPPCGRNASPEFPCRVVIDGTLDNRSELVRELGLPPSAAVPAETPGLIAAAYERWGADCAAHLIGECAFLLWDGSKRKLLAVRDAFGLRELFYRTDVPQTLIASQLQMVCERPPISDLDEEFVADFLASPAHAGPGTPFKSIRRLEAGHRLSLSASQLEIRRHWSPTEQSAPGLRDDNSERFLAVLKEAVGCCLATGGRVWSELSGGLDSSSIVSLAHEILQGEPTRVSDLATVTFIWKETPQSDERSWAEAVAGHHGLTNHQIPCDDLFFDGANEESAYRSEPHFGILCHPMIRTESELLQASGVDVLLSGARAESVVLSDRTPPLHLADRLRELRLGAFAHELLRWQRGTHRPLANLLLAFVLKPLLGRRRYLRSMDDTGALDPWVDKDFARRTKLQDRARAALADKCFRSFAQQLHYEQLVRSEQLVARGFLEWTCEVRHPFLYRPLVELALSIPWEEKVSPCEAKPLLRRSLRGRLPEKVLTRQGGSGPGPALYKAFAKRWASIEPVVRSSRLAAMGFIDSRELARAAELVRFGSAQRFVGFLGVLAFEHWLQTVTGETAPT
jgi:asparagine synthase (glutamine-hydrolysing)